MISRGPRRTHLSARDRFVGFIRASGGSLAGWLIGRAGEQLRFSAGSACRRNRRLDAVLTKFDIALLRQPATSARGFFVRRRVGRCRGRSRGSRRLRQFATAIKIRRRSRGALCGYIGFAICAVPSDDAAKSFRFARSLRRGDLLCI